LFEKASFLFLIAIKIFLSNDRGLKNEFKKNA